MVALLAHGWSNRQIAAPSWRSPRARHASTSSGSWASWGSARGRRWPPGRCSTPNYAFRQTPRQPRRRSPDGGGQPISAIAVTLRQTPQTDRLPRRAAETGTRRPAPCPGGCAPPRTRRGEDCSPGHESARLGITPSGPLYLVAWYPRREFEPPTFWFVATRGSSRSVPQRPAPSWGVPADSRAVPRRPARSRADCSPCCSPGSGPAFVTSDAGHPARRLGPPLGPSAPTRPRALAA